MDPNPSIICSFYSSDEEDTAKNVANPEHKFTPGKTPQVGRRFPKKIKKTRPKIIRPRDCKLEFSFTPGKIPQFDKLFSGTKGEDTTQNLSTITCKPEIKFTEGKIPQFGKSGTKDEDTTKDLLTTSLKPEFDFAQCITPQFGKLMSRKKEDATQDLPTMSCNQELSSTQGETPQFEDTRSLSRYAEESLQNLLNETKSFFSSISDDTTRKPDLPTTKCKLEYNINQVETPQFDRLFSGINENEFLMEKQKSDWLEYFEEKHELLDWKNNILNCFVFENESDYLNISYADLWSLVYTEGWLSDVIINAVLKSRFKYNNDVGYIETSVFESIENSFLVDTVPTPLKDDKDGYVAVKNAGGVHWVFVYLSFNDQALYVVDPKYDLTETEMEAIFNSLERCHHSEVNSKNTSKWDLRSGEWSVRKIDRQQQNDDHSCGMFCIKFAFQVMETFPNTPPMLLVGDLNAARQSFLDDILSCSKKISKYRVTDFDELE